MISLSNIKNCAGNKKKVGLEKRETEGPDMILTMQRSDICETREPQLGARERFLPPPSKGPVD